MSTDLSFEAAVEMRVDEMVDACTRCGKCVEACPSVKPAGIADAAPQDVIGGILDILRDGHGPEASRKWAQACTLSGECITACDEGVNPRFLLAMARVAIAKASHDLPARRRQGLEKYRDLGRDVAMLSQLQLNDEVLERLGQKSASVVATGRTAGLRVLHRLQRAQDAAYRAARPRHHGCARHPLSGDGRAEPLLRRRAAAAGRSRNVRADGNEQHREAVAERNQAR